jgi:hypothetical protein
MTQLAMPEGAERRRTRIEEREDGKVPPQKNLDTHLPLWFHGGMRAFLSRMRLPLGACSAHPVRERVRAIEESIAWAAKRPASSQSRL